VNGAGAIAVMTEEAEAAAPGSRQCQVHSTNHPLRTPEEMRRNREFTERCPNQAEAFIWISCPNGHEHPEEVCAGHLDAPGAQWCGHCAAEGLAVVVAITFAGWI
jgi:hypothetical protein